MSERIVYVIQEIPGTRYGRPRINILGAEEFGKLEFLLPEFSQIVFSLFTGAHGGVTIKRF